MGGQAGLLEIRDLKVDKRSVTGTRRVLEIDEFSVARGETYGIVGESGAGKTVLALTVLGLLPSPPGHIVSGSVIYNGTDLRRQSENFMIRDIRGREIAMIFQAPMSTLNPVFTVGPTGERNMQGWTRPA